MSGLRRRRRLLLSIAAAALVTGAAGGGLLGAATAAPVGPAEPAPFSAEFPDSSHRYLPDVTVSDLAARLTDFGYECGQTATSESLLEVEQVRRCHAPPGHEAGEAYADIEYDDETEVQALATRCERGPRTPEDYCPRLFAMVAEAVFAAEPERGPQAAAWAQDNARTDASTVLGGVLLVVDLDRRSLNLTTDG